MRRYLLILVASVLVTNCKQDATTEFVKEIRCYSDYSSVAWSDLSEKYYRPNAGDWDPEMNKQIKGLPDRDLGRNLAPFAECSHRFSPKITTFESGSLRKYHQSTCSNGGNVRYGICTMCQPRILYEALSGDVQ